MQYLPLIVNKSPGIHILEGRERDSEQVDYVSATGKFLWGEAGERFIIFNTRDILIQIILYFGNHTMDCRRFNGFPGLD